jgi:hypothetical protein
VRRSGIDDMSCPAIGSGEDAAAAGEGATYAKASSGTARPTLKSAERKHTVLHGIAWVNDKVGSDDGGALVLSTAAIPSTASRTPDSMSRTR